jgi:hypothetical protein
MRHSKSCQTVTETPQSFDLFRLTKSKAAVDLAPNTLRKFNAQGLAFYRRGRAVFVSKAELETFIRVGPAAFKAALAA